MRPIYFISDLHLSEDTPALNALFAHILKVWTGEISALYILGDLFEYWVGDDQDTPFTRSILAAMQCFSSATPLYIMHGNRDFLLGTKFCQQSGATLITDPHLITYHQRAYLLSHGDSYCTADTEYQKFRTLSRRSEWQQALLARPLDERLAIAHQARQKSEHDKQQYGLPDWSDVTEQAILIALNQNDWPTLIHGHTHRPALHIHQQDEKHAQRWVIQDWHDEQGGYLRLDHDGISAHPLQLSLFEP